MIIGDRHHDSYHLPNQDRFIQISMFVFSFLEKRGHVQQSESAMTILAMLNRSSLIPESLYCVFFVFQCSSYHLFLRASKLQCKNSSYGFFELACLQFSMTKFSSLMKWPFDKLFNFVTRFQSWLAWNIWPHFCCYWQKSNQITFSFGIQLH